MTLPCRRCSYLSSAECHHHSQRLLSVQQMCAFIWKVFLLSQVLSWLLKTAIFSLVSLCKNKIWKCLHMSCKLVKKLKLIRCWRSDPKQASPSTTSTQAGSYSGVSQKCREHSSLKTETANTIYLTVKVFASCGYCPHICTWNSYCRFFEVCTKILA